jgi:hypothetical protein
VGTDLGGEVLGEQLDTCLRRPVRHERVGTGPAAGRDDMVMMLPVPRLFMPGKKLLIVRNVAVKLASRSARQLSSPISSIGPGRLPLPPAQATNTSTRP